MRFPRLNQEGPSPNSPDDSDIGFGTKITNSGARLINKDGSFNIARRGRLAWTPYQSLVEISWTQFFGIIICYYLAVNALFALGFMLIGVEQLGGISPGGFGENFAESFFFSIQTFTTVGYGATSPIGVTANLLASFDALIGLMSAALATGLFFARFSRAQAQLVFSKDALIAPYRDTGLFSFQFRIANLRDGKIINLKATVILSWVVHEGGIAQRRFQNLTLERDQVTLLPLNWTIVHIIDENSPIKGWEPRDFTRQQAEVIIFIEGYDESFAQLIHVDSSYTCREIRWHARFEPMYFPEEDQTVLELDKIHAFHFLGEEE